MRALWAERLEVSMGSPGMGLNLGKRGFGQSMCWVCVLVYPEFGASSRGVGEIA